MSGTTAMAHPILACAQSIADALTNVAEVDPMYMSPEDQAKTLLLVQRDLNRLEELQLRLLAAADDMAARDGARDPAGWIAHRARLDRGDARRRQRLARSLATKWRRLGEALRDGYLTLDQAQVIAWALEQLPDDLEAGLREQAEKHLIDQAGDHSPRELRILGRKILEVVDPEGADDEERKKLEDEERRARKKTWLTFRNQGDGTTFIRGRLPTSLADRLRTYLDAFASPRRPDNGGGEGGPSTPDRSPYDVRLGRAFCSLLENWDPKRMPIHGGAATTVMITLDLGSLITGLGTATTDTGEKITAGQARRLACAADLIPVVLGKDSEVLDLGRTARFFSAAQRRAMAIRDRTCRAEGCDIPASWSEAHHLQAWTKGGKTDLKDGVLLCCWHHHRAHDPGYRNDLLPNGDFRFHRRT